MLVRPVSPPRRRGPRAWSGRSGTRPFILRSDLGATILGMISTHSLSAFTPAVGRDAAVRPPREAPAPAARMVEAGAPAAQRPLDAVPAQPARPLPRGSLLDLKV